MQGGSRADGCVGRRAASLDVSSLALNAIGPGGYLQGMSPRRTREQILAEEAVTAFIARLPNAWVKREENPDYGIDVDVEVRGDDEYLTGLRFHAQVKGTDSELDEKIFRYYFDLEWLTYYRELSQPVLLVRYSSVKKLALARWAHGVHLTPGNGETPTVRVDFAESDALTQDSAASLIRATLGFRYWKEEIPTLPLVVATSVPDDARRSNRIVKMLQNAPNRPHDLLRFRSGQPNSSEIELIVRDDQLVLSAAELSSMTLDIPILPEDIDSVVLVRTIRLLVSTVVDQLGRHELASKILGNVGDLVLMEIPEVAHRVTELLLRTERFADFFAIWKRLALYEDSDEASDLLESVFALVGAVDHLLSDLDASFLNQFDDALDEWRQRLVNDGRTQEAAQASAALGVFSFQRGLYRQAYQGLARAKRLDGEVGNIDLWQRDVSATLFELGRYRLAEKMYECLFDRDGLAATLCRKADVQLFDGRYHDSQATFAEAFQLAADQGQYVEAIWLLRANAVRAIREHYGESQRREPTNATLVLENEGPEAALALDALSAAAWSSLADLNYERGQLGNAVEAFTIAASIDSDRFTDIYRALILGVMITDPDDSESGILLAALIDVGLRRNGIVNFTEGLSDHLSGPDVPVDSDVVTRIRDLLDNIGRLEHVGTLWIRPDSDST